MTSHKDISLKYKKMPYEGKLNGWQIKRRNHVTKDVTFKCTKGCYSYWFLCAFGAQQYLRQSLLSFSAKFSLEYLFIYKSLSVKTERSQIKLLNSYDKINLHVTKTKSGSMTMTFSWHAKMTVFNKSTMPEKRGLSNSGSFMNKHLI